VLTALGLGSTAYPACVTASQIPVAAAVSGLREKLAAVLRSMDNKACAAPARLEASRDHEAVRSHLPDAALSESGVLRIAHALMALSEAEASSLASLSLSYNGAIGDVGAICSAHVLPRGLPELGLVGCNIGDGGRAVLLGWARRATRVRMLCIEGNNFSQQTSTRFGMLRRTNSHLSVYVRYERWERSVPRYRADAALLTRPYPFAEMNVQHAGRRPARS
jgi:hypothetical protein